MNDEQSKLILSDLNDLEQKLFSVIWYLNRQETLSFRINASNDLNSVRACAEKSKKEIELAKIFLKRIKHVLNGGKWDDEEFFKDAI